MKNMSQLMKQAQQMQAKMAEAQAQMETLTAEGTSGGGLVTVMLNGHGAMKSVVIDASLMTADEKEVLEDLIVAAFNDAKAKVDALVQEKMAAVTGGLKLPGGMGLPF